MVVVVVVVLIAKGIVSNTYILGDFLDIDIEKTLPPRVRLEGNQSNKTNFSAVPYNPPVWVVVVVVVVRTNAVFIVKKTLLQYNPNIAIF